MAKISSHLQRELLDCIKRLNGLSTGFEILERRRTFKTHIKKSGLSIIEQNLRKIGLSVQDVNNLNIIHVAGTNGKGSVCSYVNSILGASGSKTGLFTSPHLMSVRERIRICGQPIPAPLFVKYFNYVWEKLEPDHEVGYFPFLTLLSYHVFKEEGTEVCVYETGVGGEFDSTNIVSKPVATGIAALGIDHLQTLAAGPRASNNENIAWHKSGIFKRGCPAFTTLQKPEYMDTLQSRALELGAPLTVVGLNRSILDIESGYFGTEVQKFNASLAVSLSNIYRQKLLRTEIFHDEVSDDVQRGLRQCRLDGRLQEIHTGPFTWYLDGAHNAESIRVAGNWFSDVVCRQRDGLGTNGRPCILIFNQQSEQKDGKTALKVLYNVLRERGVHIDYAIFTTNMVRTDNTTIEDLVDSNIDPESISTLRLQRKYAELWKLLNSESEVITTSSVQEAMNCARRFGVMDGMQTLITGSFRLVGGAMHVLQAESNL